MSIIVSMGAESEARVRDRPRLGGMNSVNVSLGSVAMALWGYHMRYKF